MATRHNGEHLHHEYEDELFSAMNESGMHHEDELFSAMNEGEQFFGKLKKIARGVGGFIKRAAPMLKGIAKIALPMVATAVGGPLGGILGKVATQALGEDEGEFEDELEAGTHHEAVGHHEYEYEAAGHHEAAAHHEAMAEAMAEVAAGAHSEAEAEAMVGASAVTVLSARDRAALRRLLPHLVRGVAVLTRLLRRRRLSRPVVRTIPTIVRSTVRTLRRMAASGRPVTRRLAGRVMAAATRRILSNPRLCGMVIARNLRSSLRNRRPFSR